MKKFITAVLLTAMLLTANASAEKTYRLSKLTPRCGVITEVNRETDVVTVTEFSGRERTFKHCEDWIEGDVCAYILFGGKIIKVTYCGYLW